MNDQLKTRQGVVNRLDQAGIAYMISGSTAMNYYAQPRMTRDIDIVIELDSGNCERLVSLVTILQLLVFASCSEHWEFR